MGPILDIHGQLLTDNHQTVWYRYIAILFPQAMAFAWLEIFTSVNEKIEQHRHKYNNSSTEVDDIRGENNLGLMYILSARSVVIRSVSTELWFGKWDSDKHESKSWNVDRTQNVAT